jgi:hypothetical protein
MSIPGFIFNNFIIMSIFLKYYDVVLRFAVNKLLLAKTIIGVNKLLLFKNIF